MEDAGGGREEDECGTEEKNEVPTPTESPKTCGANATPTKEEDTEGRESRRVPGGTWLSQVRHRPPKQAADVAKGPQGPKRNAFSSAGPRKPNRRPAARAPKLRVPRPDRPPVRLSLTLSLPAVRNCRERPQSLSSPCRKSARGAEDSTRPGPAEPDLSAVPGHPAMLHLSPGPPRRHRQARPHRSRPQDKQIRSFSPRPGGASLGVGHLARRPGHAPQHQETTLGEVAQFTKQIFPH
ncbi:hypothetical protein NDU88_004273 [Pleurodeles waltl]|uniref:Uncharacterized protein n=1 Tax=Pleurodeles waltl TaxID=8319 RepID=A0AAV7W996_PLEWA|nr:hypothetical protein NDU88_004273 [Pleurodeles waltl]